LKKNPKVSVVIPTIGRIEYLDKTIFSLLNQSNNFDEIIIFDNSEKQNIEKLSKFSSNYNLKFIKSGKKLDPINSWNNAVLHASGDYITIVGDDDLVDFNYRKEIDLILQKGKLGILKGRKIDEKDNIIAELIYPKDLELTDEKFRELRFNSKITLLVPGIVFNKKDFLKVGGFVDTGLNGCAYADDLLIYKLSYINKKIIISNNICWSYRIHTQQIGNLNSLCNYYNKILYYIDIFEYQLKKIGLREKELYKNYSREKYIIRILNSEINKFMSNSIKNNNYNLILSNIFKNFIFNNRVNLKIKVILLNNIIKKILLGRK
jgi:glycosyltransferase involved in cell wall biosynthesis